ncbi:uncharacterized protein [Maniola hyperantus]|uniref:uncharacterized protein n=1 Tax=Aphantopus hyperantus TaxID=2795564 RepID=UPI00374A7C04
MSCKLDSVTNREWETHRNKLKDSPTLDIFLKFISNTANVLETLDTTKQDTNKQDNTKHIVVNHKPKSLLASTKSITPPAVTENVALSANNQSHDSSFTTSTVLLSTALVKVLDSNGQSHAARILLDNGSTTNFVTKDFCRKLNLNTVSAKYKVTGINNQALCGTESCSVTFESYIGCFRTGIDCIVLPIITTPQPSTNIKLQDLQIPSGICLADPSFHIPSTIDILVGADIFWSVIGTNRICLGKNKPTLFETQLGWIVSGTVRTNSKNDNICMLSSNLDFDLSRFWELDSISSKHNLTPEERACEEHFMKTTKRKPDGRFIVSLPLKESPEVLGDSYQMAKSRFLSLERKLARDSNMRQLYVEFMKEYLTLDHMTEQKTLNNKACYLPHHGVLKESRTTTKLRVVYDASAATKSGKSLNDILRVGPTVQDDLLSILLHFRQHKLKGTTVQPIMGQLPEQRAQLEFPFLSTGVDYAGPVIIANHKGRGCGDGVARVADIKTKKGIIRRAFNNICPLPTSLEDTSTPGVCSG